MKPSPITVVGIGELGSVFSHGFLRLGHPVYPVIRGMNIGNVLEATPDLSFVLIAVAEKDLDETLAAIPPKKRSHIVLLQNELLPRNWGVHEIASPTVISVWFEKKKGQNIKVLRSSPIFGPHAEIIAAALAIQNIPAHLLSRQEDLVFELVVKNTFVYTINICGLQVGGTTGRLWRENFSLVEAVANEVIDIQEWLTDSAQSRRKIMEQITAGMNGDPAHKCMGRTAAGRLTRCLAIADEAGLEVPTIRRINAEMG